MKLEINQKHRREVQKSFDNHCEELSDCNITNVQIDLDVGTIDYFHEAKQYIRTEKRIFTYEGFTQSHKKFTLTIED